MQCHYWVLKSFLLSKLLENNMNPVWTLKKEKISPQFIICTRTSINLLTSGFTMNGSKTSILYYDSTCKFCIGAKSVAFKIESKQVSYLELDTKKIQSFKKELHLSRQTAENAMFYRDKNKNLHYGSSAFFVYLQERKGLLFFIGQLGSVPIVKWYAEKVYNCIALNRYFISRFIP